MIVKNLFAGPPALIEELFDTLIKTGNFKLERIISPRQSAPQKTWYDQDRDEWVLLVSGEAGLLFEGEKDALVLHPGDHILIPAHRRHRVEWTAVEGETVWLALHFKQ